MPSPARVTWPVHIQLVSHGKKPRKADWPGLDTAGLVCGKYPNGRKVWRFCLDNLLAN